MRKTLGPLSLMLICPPVSLLFWYTSVFLQGSFQKLSELMLQNGVLNTTWEIWKPHFFGSQVAWTIIGIFALFELILMKIIPGKVVYGPETPSGEIPQYKDNGLTCYLITIAAFVICTCVLNLFPMTILYDHFGDILGALNLFSFLFCLALYFKGRFAPSSKDHGASGNFIFDYYWGTELYPRIFGWDVKQFTNCRFGMMSWIIICLSYAAKQNELYGISDSMIVAVGLQFIYVTKFYVWESGYLRSLDIMHDRAGFYICWGCLTWVPGVYTISTSYLVQHPNHLGFPIAAAIFVIGAAAILMNYFADRQRQMIRQTDGKCKVWGKNPILIKAFYTNDQGETKQSLLLASGWWGVARHFHYVPEIIGAFCWTLPALFENFFPYFYVVFLTILLLDRSFRDDERCQKKYGEYWDQYCELVPSKIIPYF